MRAVCVWPHPFDNVHCCHGLYLQLLTAELCPALMAESTALPLAAFTQHTLSHTGPTCQLCTGSSLLTSDCALVVVFVCRILQ